MMGLKPLFVVQPPAIVTQLLLSAVIVFVILKAGLTPAPGFALRMMQLIVCIVLVVGIAIVILLVI